MVFIKCVSFLTEFASEEGVEKTLRGLGCDGYFSSPLYLHIKRNISFRNAQCHVTIIDAQDIDFFGDAVKEDLLLKIVMEEIQNREKEGFSLVRVSFSLQEKKIFLSFLKKENRYI